MPAITTASITASTTGMKSLGSTPTLWISMEAPPGDPEMAVNLDRKQVSADLRITSAQRAREIAQHLEGALVECVAFAQALERKENEKAVAP